MSPESAAPALTEAFATPLENKEVEAQAAEISPEQAKAERALVWRLDIFMMTIGFLGYCMKNLDVSSNWPVPPTLHPTPYADHRGIFFSSNPTSRMRTSRE